ncbi:hypothetical protein I4U23_005531 [Adineta vaga]|nr:hypothetical protein I4U23_005531 [Adineta vaga]
MTLQENLQLGDSCPTDVNDAEPVGIVYDPSASINQTRDLYPFESVIEVHNVEINYLSRIQMPNEVFVTTALFKESDADNVKVFVETYLHNNQAVLFYYLIFTDGQQYDNLWPNIYSPKLVWCCSITDNNVWALREACAKANSLTIEYCGRRTRQFNRAGQINRSHRYTEKKLRLVRLQRIYTEELEKSMELDRKPNI